MKMRFIAAVAISALLGLIHVLASEDFWNHWAILDPMPHWLALHVTASMWRTLLFGRDFLINTILCLPLAFALRLLHPYRPWIYLAIAMLTEALWEYRFVLTTPLEQGLGYGMFIPGLIMTISAFAASGAVMGMLTRRRI